MFRIGLSDSVSMMTPGVAALFSLETKPDAFGVLLASAPFAVGVADVRAASFACSSPKSSLSSSFCARTSVSSLCSYSGAAGGAGGRRPQRSG